MASKLINVGIAQVMLGDKTTILRTILGSCVGICIYDKVTKVGGLGHILLPEDSTKSNNREKFAETAVPYMVELLTKDGCKVNNMTAKIAGGASMFNFAASFALGNIGDKNVEMTLNMLQRFKIPVLEQDVGGNVGRVIDFDISDGSLKVKAGGKEQILYKI
jgi:chemotaxis protein CheD